ncbi:DUF456 domain-containing protein [Natrialba sp. PRR66]|uniref:DUF456 domain-containing protein n=1 Tax=Natrialba sp. PRR66 TaxID=3098146 RepID=UPI002B1D19F7|nr:DUF456 domain-containing protein [Natrialba sp. PRR66]
MVDAGLVLAVAVLLGGVLGTVVPLVPGGALSLAGVYLYWWLSGFTAPGPIALAVLTILGLVTLFVELFAGSIAARAGGASWVTTGIAAVVGIVLMVVTGPLGLLFGLFGTVFVVEYLRVGDLDRSTQSAIYATAGILASTAIQVLLTVSILCGFLIAVVVL